MLTSKVTKRFPIPHEPEEWIEVRLLSWLHLEEARLAKQAKVFESMRSMGGDVLHALQEARAEGPVDAAPVELDPIAQYDQETLLRSGIVSWSYPEPVSAIGELDAETAEWAARVILNPSERTEEDRKNASSPSTEH